MAGPTCLCILHTKQVAKKLGEFEAELVKVFSDENAEHYDLSAAVFPQGGWEAAPPIVDRPIYLNGATFLGDLLIDQIFKQDTYFHDTRYRGDVAIRHGRGAAQFARNAHFFQASFEKSVDIQTAFGNMGYFGGARFAGETEIKVIDHNGAYVSFTEASFSKPARFSLFLMGEADFLGAYFDGKADFSFCTFVGGIDFEDAQFNGSAVFRKAVFGDQKQPDRKSNFYNCRFCTIVKFYDTSFNGVVNFRRSKFSEPQNVQFSNNDLSLTNFNGCDISEVRFYRVRWNRSKRKWYYITRDRVHDECRLEKHDKTATHEQFEAVGQSYRRLQENYGETYRYTEAGDFYIGEQEMVRKAQGSFRRFFCLAFLYKLLSFYGQSYRLPLVWLGLTLFALFPLLFGISGITYESQELALDLDWSSDPTDFVFFSADYWKLFNANLDFITFSRGTADACLDQLWQKLAVKVEIVWIVSLVTFFLLALRRRFKRKSF